MVIGDEPSGSLKEEIKIEQMVKVEILDTSKALMGRRLNIKDKPYIVVPTDYPCALTLQLTNKVMLLWANDEEERQLWVEMLGEMIAHY